MLFCPFESTMMIAVPVALFLIFSLLYITFSSVKLTLLLLILLYFTFDVILLIFAATLLAIFARRSGGKRVLSLLDVPSGGFPKFGEPTDMRLSARSVSGRMAGLYRRIFHGLRDGGGVRLYRDPDLFQPSFG